MPDLPILIALAVAPPLIFLAVWLDYRHICKKEEKRWS